MRKHYFILILSAAFIVALDQATKFVISQTVPLYGTIPVIQGFFNLVYTYNRGMAFGLFNRPGQGHVFLILTIAAVAAVGLLVFWFSRLKNKTWGVTLTFALIMGGAVGNLIDRFYRGAVIDFLDFRIGSHAWPAFNVADSAITVGTLWLAYYLFMSPDNKL